jgi:hypothetical protein
VIEGDVINNSAQERATPKVLFRVLGHDGTEIFHWTVVTDDPRVKPRGWVAFSARLESPPSDIAALEIQTLEAE